MSRNYNVNFVHCIFSTKDRRDTSLLNFRKGSGPTWAGLQKKVDCNLLAVGGTANHVHILSDLRPVASLAVTIQKLKANSSRWLGEQGVTFEWRKGRGAFSVSPSMLATVKAYIRGQAEQHRRRDFEEEFLRLLQKSRIAFDRDQRFACVPSLKGLPVRFMP